MKTIKKRGLVKTASLRRAGSTYTAWKVMVLTSVFLMAFVCSPQAAVEKVDGGIRFSYYAPDADQVSLAGTINGWSADATRMTKNDEGYWSIVLKLDAGEHEYKFVVDGAWTTDPDNASTKPDPYGGANSLVTVSNKGDIVVKAGTDPISNTPLNALVHIGGRYNMRSYTQKNIEGDPRWRMHRPEHNLDLNFRVTINEIVQGYFRLRVDSSTDELQPNNISAYLEDAHIKVSPEHFSITGYYNKEILKSNDPLSFYGDVDLVGTIFDDHLKQGKGTSGLVVTTTQAGIDFEAFAANVHDYDIYNSPDLYDNTGTDIYSVRASKSLRQFRVGADLFITRNIWWLDFTDRVGTSPINTGFPRMDEYLGLSDDPSTWFEFEDRTLYMGCDISAELYDGKLVPGLEYLQGKVNQGFVRSNSSGLDLGNGPIDVPIMDRDATLMFGGIRNTMIENLMVNFEHTRKMTRNAWQDEVMIMPLFLTEVLANKQLFFVSSSVPYDYTHDYSELEFRWTDDKYDARLWFERNLFELDMVDTGLSDIWYYDYSISSGLSFSPYSKLDLDFEARYTSYDGSSNTDYEGNSSFESILRGDYSLTSKVAAIFDIRLIRYVFTGSDPGQEVKDTFIAPFAGFEYRPIHKVSITLAYGIDPLDFSIDYEGRHTGRYNFRNEYLWDHPAGTILDAEEALEDRKAFVLRAVFNF